MEIERSPRPTRKPRLHYAFIAAQTIRILLAEDDREMRRLLASVLRKEGFEVVAVADGNELLSVLASQMSLSHTHATTDLIISDVRMPGHSGLDVLAGLRRSGWDTPILLITAFGDDETHAHARRLGAAAIMDKPFDLDDLTMAVLNLAAQRDERRLGARKR